MTVNQAETYGVRIDSTMVAGPAWRVRSVRHLSGKENHSRHNIFIKAFDADGNRDRNPALRCVWHWDGQRSGEYAKPAQLDKRDGETGHADIPMEKGQIITIAISGDGYLSDVVSGLHAMHPDEEAGNTWGHHSFLIEFQRTNQGTVAPPIEPPDPVLPPIDGDLAQQVTNHEQRLRKIEALLNSWQGD